MPTRPRAPVATRQVGPVPATLDPTSELRARCRALERQNEALQLAHAEMARARDKAEAANAARGRFLAHMSHELRTPMNAIVGLTHLLRADAQDPVQQARLARVSDAAGHLTHVLDDTLDLAKIDAGRLELETTDFSLRALLTRCADLVRPQIQAKGLALQVDASGVPDALCGDPVRLSQALLNLLANAVKFTDQGGVALRAELLARDDKGLRLVLRVRDTGIGIRPEHIGRLFTPFGQAEASTTRRFGGTGLGLAITQRLAELMGGDVQVTSQPGVGSEFQLTVQLREGSPDAAAAACQPADAAATLRRLGSRVRLLLADDNPINRDVTRELLQSLGLQVDTAANGRLALDQATRQHYDLVLMDMQMPEMDGLEATRRLRALPRSAHTPVIAMTASAFSDDRAACLAAGMNDHVAKPVDPGVLFAALLRWLPQDAGVLVPAGGPRPVRAPGTSAGTPRAADAAAAVDAGGAPARLDQALGLRQLGGHRGLAQRFLRQFWRHYNLLLPTLQLQAVQRDFQALHPQVHSLRGAAATIGATRLCRLAEALEAAIGSPQPVADRTAAALAMLDELAVLLGEIRTRLPPDPTPP